MTTSVRQQILEYMVNRFAAATVGTHGVEFSTVELGPLDAGDFKQRYSIGIVPRSERFIEQYPLLLCFMAVSIEFRITINRGDPKPVLMGEKVLTAVKQIVAANPKWNNLAIDTKFVGSEIDVESYGDRTVMGVLAVEVEFRHARRDPVDPNPTV